MIGAAYTWVIELILMVDEIINHIQLARFY